MTALLEMKSPGCFSFALVVSSIAMLAVLHPKQSSSAADVDVASCQVAAIPPGTVIGDIAPKGWTDLVIRSHPRVAPDSQDKVSASTARYAGMLFTAVLANVQSVANPQNDEKYMLSGVAAGLGVKIKGQYTIINSETQSKLGADLGFIEAQVLSSAEKQLKQMCFIARSPTMAFVETPSTMYYNKKNVKIALRYAFLVDPRTGRLDTLLWAMQRGDDDGLSAPLGPMQWLPPNKIEDCQLHVDSDEFFLGIPSTKAFAMSKLPQGKLAIEFPKELKNAASQEEFTVASAQTLERELRTLLPKAEMIARKPAP
jgi:hypothetical protein